MLVTILWVSIVLLLLGALLIYTDHPIIGKAVLLINPFTLVIFIYFGFKLGADKAIMTYILAFLDD